MNKDYRRQLVEQLQKVAAEAEQHGELATAGILLTLCGALLAGSESLLHAQTHIFALQEVQRLSVHKRSTN